MDPGGRFRPPIYQAAQCTSPRPLLSGPRSRREESPSGEEPRAAGGAASEGTRRAVEAAPGRAARLVPKRAKPTLQTEVGLADVVVGEERGAAPLQNDAAVAEDIGAVGDFQGAKDVLLD